MEDRKYGCCGVFDRLAWAARRLRQRVLRCLTKCVSNLATRSDCDSRAVSVASGMMRSSPSQSQISTSFQGVEFDYADGTPDAMHVPRPVELGCVNPRGHPESHMQVGPPGRTKMRKLDDDMLVTSKMHKLGQSYSGRIFRGMWVSDEGLETPVVVKVFHHFFNEETSKHVSKDLKGQLVLRHRNLLCPLGYGVKEGKLHLVYEYMVNGSLDQHLFAKEGNTDQGPGWARRCSIINGVAAALLHLHSNGAVHGSIKCSNILLDQDMTVRLGDFGYSRAIATMEPSSISYLPRESCPRTVFPIRPISKETVFASSEPTFEKDVFFFGLVILEIVCGKNSINGIVDWVLELYEGLNILGAVDETLAAAGDFNEADAEKLLVLGLACSHPDPKKRPQMQHIVNILAGSEPTPVVPKYRDAVDDLQVDLAEIVIISADPVDRLASEGC